MPGNFGAINSTISFLASSQAALELNSTDVVDVQPVDDDQNKMIMM
jgi:hypothetical protein